VPTPRKPIKSADLAELKAAADRLAEALADVDEEEVVAEFKQLRARETEQFKKAPPRTRKAIR
jgi:anti-sigma factor RsiW